jgi:riboflavin synthase
MFTGLVQSLGRVGEVSDDGHGGRVLRIVEPNLAPTLDLGESVAVNGACLTVVERDAESFRFLCGPETLLKTTLGRMTVGDRVNLERALRVGDRLGGHFVTGHVDAVGTVTDRQRSGEWENFRFACPADLAELMVPKGSIAVDGVSLTVVDVGPDGFRVMLIPHTLAHTTLGFRGVGADVNLEADLLAKHVRKLVRG